MSICKTQSHRIFNRMSKVGLYIHIPFCVRKCLYCDFVSYVGKESDVGRYFEAVHQEFTWYLQHAFFSEYKPVSLYIGGGTPSLVIEELVAFIQAHQKILSSESLREMTIEVNPGTIYFSQFQQLRQVGFNRVSIGVQSLHDTELRTLGRIHTSEEAVMCVDAARRGGFENISIDLIFGVSGSNLMKWKSTLTHVISMNPEHIAIYNLTIEENTPFWEQQQQGILLLPDEDLQLEMYKVGVATLTQAGYEHYEISNFALPGYRSQHNQIYWRNEEYLGLGAGAHSYLKRRRYWNDVGLESYITRNLSTAKTHNAHNGSILYPPPVEGEERLDMKGRIGETVMMNLRLLEGVNLSTFQHRFGQSLESLYTEPLEKLCSLELIEIIENHLRLTPKGILLSNEVFQEFVNP